MNLESAKSQWMYSLLINDFDPSRSLHPSSGLTGAGAWERVKSYRHHYLKRIVLCSLVEGYSEMEQRKMTSETRYV